MASHEATSKTDEWYTPPWIFGCLGVTFDLDPCCPHSNQHVPAKHYYTQSDDGLSQPWHGLVWLNPPFGKRNGIKPWLERLIEHGDGIAIVPNRTATDWWQDAAKAADLILFVRRKVKFLSECGTEGKSPGYGNVMFAYGGRSAMILRTSSIKGILLEGCCWRDVND